MNPTITRPALRYFGGKWKLADWITGYFPAHKCYLEPFGGAASVLLQKQPAPIEVYNDLNGDVVNYFRMLREQPEALIQLLELTPYSRQEFNDCLDLSVGDDLERARRFYVRSWQGRSFGGRTDRQNTWRAFCNPDNVSHTLAASWVIPDNLRALSNRLRNVQIEQTDALRLIEKYDKPGLLIYADPPYELSTRPGSGFRYKNESSDDLQRELADVLNRCRSMVILSGYRCDEYDTWYADWKRVDRKALTQASNKGTDRASAIESLWINRAAQAHLPTLF